MSAMLGTLAEELCSSTLLVLETHYLRRLCAHGTVVGWAVGWGGVVWAEVSRVALRSQQVAAAAVVSVLQGVTRTHSADKRLYLYVSAARAPRCLLCTEKPKPRIWGNLNPETKGKKIFFEVILTPIPK